MALLSRLDFGSFLSYTPRPIGGDPAQQRAKDFTIAIKEDRATGEPAEPMSKRLATTLLARYATLPFQDYFSPTTALVPIPSSSLRSTGALWVPLNLVKALAAVGLGQPMPMLSRRVALPKSATAEAKRRSTADAHFRSLDVDARLDAPDDILLVDDVITRGATMLGAASRLQLAFPSARIRGFAMVRTISSPEDFVALLQPCVGSIQLRGDGQTLRRP